MDSAQGLRCIQKSKKFEADQRGRKGEGNREK